MSAHYVPLIACPHPREGVAIRTGAALPGTWSITWPLCGSGLHEYHSVCAHLGLVSIACLTRCCPCLPTGYDTSQPRETCFVTRNCILTCSMFRFTVHCVCITHATHQSTALSDVRLRVRVLVCLCVWVCAACSPTPLTLYIRIHSV